MKEKTANSTKNLIDKPDVLVTKSKSINHNFPVAGIGASAGGLEALEVFFENTPTNSGIAYIIIQHQDPSHVSLLPELLQKKTTMKVNLVTDGMKVKPNSIYIIPHNKSMSILNSTLLLFDPIEPTGFRLPIDLFFRSLATDKKENSIAIILSGMGSDGSLGIKAIKENNGIVLVQKPDTAKFNSMPQFATESVEADIIAPAEELPSKLIAFLENRPKITTIKTEDDFKNSLEKIISLLRETSGNDFSMYKKNTFLRRIERRKEVHQIATLKNYVRFLQENTHECEILFKELLIGVTAFFRDTDVWEKLKQVVFPEILSRFPKNYVMRAWVTGCSTGEEAYSLAIIFREIMAQNNNPKNISLQIFATDLDKEAIEKARKGYFNFNISSDVSPERLQHYFTLEGDGFRINNAVREMIVFAPQNVTNDPPFTKLDFISCRNMLIYMETELQKKVIKLFNYSLNPNGVLLLGTSETIGNNADLFKEIDTKLKIFQRKSSIQISELIDFPSSFNYTKIVKTDKPNSTKQVENIQTLADQFLLHKFVPPSVLVNEKGDILYISGRTGKYLEPVAGKANWNVHSMAREGLNHELLSAFHEALQHHKPVTIHNIKVTSNEGYSYVNLMVQRIENPLAIKDMIMIVFMEVNPYTETENTITKNGSKITNAKQIELEKDLQRCREEIHTLQEEMETSQEELKATNEELQSTNEELQSTNEELTTSKEEMQSLNEELQTVNSELQLKISDYIRSNDDMKNLLNSTEVATLFIDRGLNIRKYTDQVTKIFKIRNTDIGRPFTDLVTDLKYPEIEEHSKQVTKSLVFKENAIETTDGKWFNVRIMPYRTIDDHIDGLVITFTDITTYKNLEVKLKESEERFKISLQNTPISVFNQDKNLVYTWIHNPYINLKPEEIIGKKDEDFLSQEYASKLKVIKKNVLNTGKGINTPLELSVNNINYSYTLFIDALKDSKGNIIGITGATWDNSKQIQK